LPSVAALALLTVAGATTPTTFGNNGAITPQRLRAHLEFIASDELEGRDTPSRGLDIATLYVATQLKLWGAKPAGDNGTFFQSVSVPKEDPSGEKKLKYTVVGRNVVAIIPGSDPKLKNEYVAFGAHIDHLGMAADGTDRIYNGADDDGSGTVSLLEIAHALLTGPRPKRSCLFVWHIGEEKGLWGSLWFTERPTVNLKNVVAQLNVDMVGRSKQPGDTKPANQVLTGPNEIYVVGSTKMSTDLERVSRSVNDRFLKLKFNYKYDEPKDPEQIFYRSDHYNYARKGIPIIFYFDGVSDTYHQVGDEVSTIDFVKMSRVARTVYATAWTLANAPKRPVVDKPLKE
jgi:Zn-dependent M28 family amino/carboxypeptidase